MCVSIYTVLLSCLVFTPAFFLYVRSYVAPDGPPSLVEAKPFSNSVIMVTCHPPTPELANGIITGYTGEYCVCGMDQCSEPARVTMAIGMNSVSLQGLQEQTMYCVRAAAHTSQGAGPWSGWVTVLTNLAGRCVCVCCIYIYIYIYALYRIRSALQGACMIDAVISQLHTAHRDHLNDDSVEMVESPSCSDGIQH